MGTGQCLRPIPYLKSETVRKINMHPGAILDGELIPNRDVKNPHLEDATYKSLKYVGVASTEDFKAILDKTLSPSIAAGFGVQFLADQKHIPVGQQANCSIITVKISPNDLNILEDEYNPGRIKASLTDGAGHSYRYLSITDKGFFEFAQKHQKDGKLNELRTSLRSQREVYLRIGVGRQFQVGQKDGYWLQVNGIYTFPEFLEEIRS